MRFSAIFEAWHIGDGNYPPLSVGDLVNLSFEVQPNSLHQCEKGEVPFIEDFGTGECRFIARVLRVYGKGGPDALAVLDTGILRFYINDRRVNGLEVGATVKGEGTLLLDHYIWVEFLDSYEDPPDLFYNLRVIRIRRVAIPDRFVSRSKISMSYPTRVLLSELGPSEIQDLTTMKHQTFREEFYIVNFSDEGLSGMSIPRTFC